MGTVVDTQVDGEKDTDESDFGKIGASNPVVYQLVRVEGDGTLVPATDDEIMEVEHMLEEDKGGLVSDETTKHFDGCISNERLPSKKSDFEGLSQSKNAEVDSQKMNARLEYIEVMLQKVKQEERLRLSTESLNHSTKCMDVNCQTSDSCNETQACKDKLQSENASMEMAPSMILNGSHSAQVGSAETCSGPANESVTSRSSVSEICNSSMPDFSILKGEICLDNLSIRELQEAFRATFGRQTSVKDKLWLKRRITMGLTNSCDVPAASFVIRDNKIVHKEVKEEPSGLQKSQIEAGSFLTDQVNDPTINNSEDLPTSPANRSEDQQSSGKRLRKPISEYDEKNENLQMEQFAAKRVRKPTRRYIEELSEFETRECTARLLSSVKITGHCQSSPKSRIRPVRVIGSRDTTLSTRQDSLGGFGIQVPYVSRVRRGRPRKNFVTLMKYHPSGIASNQVKTALGIPALQQNSESGSKGRKAKAAPTHIPQPNFVDEREKNDAEKNNNDEEEQDPGLEKFVATGDNTDDNAIIQPQLKGGVRRKHHRAWTLGEVLKLVEGVARYGAGRWSEIRRLAFASYSYRTSVDLKDKWRNLLRASLAQGPTDKGARNSRKHTSIPIPTPILTRVRELAEMHSQTGIEIGPSKITGHGGRIVQEKGSGFL